MELTLRGLPAYLSSPRTSPKGPREASPDTFQLSRPKMAMGWGLAMAGSYLSGAVVNAAWDALGLAPTANLGPVGMLIGGGIGAAATFFLTREKLGDLKAAGCALVAGAASAAAWSYFGLAGLREGLGMAIGGGIGVAIGLKSVPKEHRSFWGTVAAGTLGLGFCHSAGIVGAATGFSAPALTVALTSIYTGIGAASGNIVAKANQRYR